MTGTVPDILSDLPPAAPRSRSSRARPADVELLTGDVVDVDLLADIPLTDAAGAPQEVLALVPFRQVRERGFECHDDGAPLRCLIVRDRAMVT